MVVDKILFNWLRRVDYLIRMDMGNAIRKVYKSNMYKRKRWGRPERQRACTDIKMLDFGLKLGCLEFLTKAGLNRIAVVAPLR